MNIVNFYTDEHGYRRLNTCTWTKVAKPIRLLRKRPPYDWSYVGSNRYAAEFYERPYIERTWKRKLQY